MTQSEMRRGRKMGMAPENPIRVWLGDLRVRLSSQRQFSAQFFLWAIVFILAFFLYAQFFVVRPLREEARQNIERYAFFYRIATTDTLVVQPGLDLDIIFDTITNTNFPIVITEKDGTPHLWKAVDMPQVSPDSLSVDQLEKMQNIVAALDQENPPLTFVIPKVGERVLHYGDPPFLRRLAWLPWIAIGVTALFVSVGYIGFQHIKNNEQRSIWVGMARETAHQLGTPLSSLYGWLALLKADADAIQDAEFQQRFRQIIAEMDRDTGRLDKIASRFSLIGSTPELRPSDVRDVVRETAAYLRVRLPKDVQILESIGEVPVLPLNRELLNWAFENLFKNAADAMEGRGGRIEVSSRLHEDASHVDIEIRDNGKGIPPHLAKQIFIPGYSTKKRGWGLGLAFVKRIVEDYHRGKIYVKESALGEGTTFVVSLPLPPKSTGELG